MEDSKKPAYTKGYGEAKENNMNPKEQETKPKGITRREFLKAEAVAIGCILSTSLV